MTKNKLEKTPEQNEKLEFFYELGTYVSSALMGDGTLAVHYTDDENENTFVSFIGKDGKESNHIEVNDPPVFTDNHETFEDFAATINPEHFSELTNPELTTEVAYKLVGLRNYYLKMVAYFTDNLKLQFGKAGEEVAAEFAYRKYNEDFNEPYRFNRVVDLLNASLPCAITDEAEAVRFTQNALTWLSQLQSEVWAAAANGYDF